MRWFWRRDRIDTREEEARAARLDDALATWRAGDVDLAAETDPKLADELATARRVSSYADATPPAPHEPLVTLRAALAARAANRLPTWRRFLFNGRLAPIAVGFAVAGLMLGLSTANTDNHAKAPIAAADQARQYLRLAAARLQEVQGNTASTADPSAFRDAIAAAELAASKAQATAELARGEERKRLLALVAAQQHTINKLKAQVGGLTPTVVAVASTTTTTTTTTLPPAPTTTTTTVPPSTTTTRLAPTTTTRPPTTTTTRPPPPTTTTPPPSGDGDFGTGNF